jgi:hypothetical protein
MKELKNKTIKVKFFSFDDAEENCALEKDCKQNNLAVNFEYCGPCTFQRNRKFEHKFQTLYGRIREIMKYVPSLCVNLFSLNKVLKKGFKVSNDGVVVSLNYKHVKLTFDRVIHATDGSVTGVSMKPILCNNINEFANASISSERIYDINHLHKLFGHCG